MGTFRGKKIKNTYTGIVQYSGSKFYDALGNQISASIDITSSYAVYSDTANTSSFAITASYAESFGTLEYSELTGIPSNIVSSSNQIELQISGASDILSSSVVNLSSSFEDRLTTVQEDLTSVSSSFSSDLSDIINGIVPVATASYAISASHEINYEVSSSYANFAETASVALNVSNINTGSFATTGSNIFYGRQTITGSLYTVTSASSFSIQEEGIIQLNINPENPGDYTTLLFISNDTVGMSTGKFISLGALPNTASNQIGFPRLDLKTVDYKNSVVNEILMDAYIVRIGDESSNKIYIGTGPEYLDPETGAFVTSSGVLTELISLESQETQITGSVDILGNQTISGSLFVSGGTDLSGTNTISGSNTIVGGTSIGSIGAGRTLIYGTTEYNAGYTHFRAPNLVNFESTPIFEVGLEVTGSINISGSVSISNNLTVEGSILGTITSASYATTASYAESTPAIPGVSGTGLGWARYDDGVYNTGSVFNVTVAGGEVTLPNSASTVINEHMHSTVEFYDSASAKIQVENVNDVYMQTVVFKAKTGNANGTYVRIQLDSTAGTPYERVGKDLFFNKGNDIWHEFHEVFQYYADSDFVSNGNRWKIQAFNQDVEVADIVYFIQRTQNHGVE